MKVTLKRLVGYALRLLDEHPEIMEQAVDFGDLEMDIRSLASELAPQAVRKALLDAPVADIDEAMPLTGALCTDGASRLLELPDDFLRLVEFRMSDWSRSMTECGTLETGSVTRWHPEVLMHHPRGADPEQLEAPALELGFGPKGRVLRIYGTGPRSTVATARYLPAPQPEAASFTIPAGLFHAAASQLARMIHSIVCDV